MGKTHWKKLQNPDYLGAYSLDEGKDMILTIDYVRLEEITGADGKREECTICHFKEPGVKPMILNATNCKTIAKMYHSNYIEDWFGRKIQIYAKTIKAFGDTVDALRIRPNIPKVQAEIVCSVRGGKITPAGKMSAEQLAVYTQGKYGRPMCSACATKEAQRITKEAEEEISDAGTSDESKAVSDDLDSEE